MGLIRFHECLVFFPMTIYLNGQRGLRSISCGSFSLQGTTKKLFPGVNLKWENGLFKRCLVQREAKRWASGSVKFVSAVSYLPCLACSIHEPSSYCNALLQVCGKKWAVGCENSLPGLDKVLLTKGAYFYPIFICS